MKNQKSDSGQPQVGSDAVFDFMVEVRKTPSLAAIRRQQVQEWKNGFRIFTHKGPDDWMAISMDECCWKLEGHGLTKEQQTNGVALMAGYCRLLDEAGMIHFGETEHEACESLVTRLCKSNNQAEAPSLSEVDPPAAG